MFQSRLSSHGYRRVALSEDQADFEDGEREAEESVQNFLRTSRKKTEGTEQELEVFRKRDQELRDGDEGGAGFPHRGEKHPEQPDQQLWGDAAARRVV